jgi:hypothetical protein
VPFILKILFTYVTKQATLMMRSTVLSPPLQLVFPECIEIDIPCLALPYLTYPSLAWSGRAWAIVALPSLRIQVYEEKICIVL